MKDDSELKKMEKAMEHWKGIAQTNARTVGQRDKEILDLLRENKTLRAELRNLKRNED